MTYTIEIRDLTNEGKELKVLKEDVNSNCEIRTKKIEILAENHINAICSYFKHIKEEIDKLELNGFNSQVLGYDSLSTKCVFYISNGEMKLNITPTGYSYLKTFKIDIENMKIAQCGYASTICGCKEYLKELMRDWEELKKNINANISKEIERIKKETNLKEINSKEELSFFENFTI